MTEAVDTVPAETAGVETKQGSVLEGDGDRLYLKGRYLKLRRDISQTPFVLRGGQVMSETSVEAVIFAQLTTFVKGDSMKFIPAGREDMDVRMIGTGRPFAIEIKNPTTLSLTLEEMERMRTALSDVSSGVVVRDLQIAKRDVVLMMKSGEEEMQKCYGALVWISRKVTSTDLDLLNHLKGVTISQWTPLRVAHRRANAERNKVIHWMKAKPVEKHDHYLLLDLCTSAGCYIKEFINGDFGRTCPSLYDLLQVDQAHCTALDVTHVDLDLERGPEKATEDSINKKSKHNPNVTSSL